MPSEESCQREVIDSLDLGCQLFMTFIVCDPRAGVTAQRVGESVLSLALLVANWMRVTHLCALLRGTNTCHGVTSLSW